MRSDSYEFDCLLTVIFDRLTFLLSRNNVSSKHIIISDDLNLYVITLKIILIMNTI